MYSEKTGELFKTTPVTIPEPKPGDKKDKRKKLLAGIGGKWYINNI